MIRVLIVDDERLARAELQRMLRAHPDVEVIGEAANASDARAAILELNPDLLLLDIQMPDGTGFDLLQSLDRAPPTIFTTAYDQYALQAFEVSALDYLLKPIDDKRLTRALNRIRGHDGASTPQAQAETPGAGGESKLFIKDGQRCWFVAFDRIAAFESEGNYSRVFFDDQHPLMLRSLAQLEASLDPRQFVRVSRQHIVNIDWVKETRHELGGGMLMILRNGLEIGVSRRRAAELRASAQL